MSRKHFRSWYSFRAFQDTVESKQRYILDQASKEFLETLLLKVSDRILPMKAGHILWRARLGHKLRRETDMSGEIEFDAPGPRPPEQMLPQTDRARQGRANPTGIPYLYLATNEKAALMEVRPWLGAMISVSQFRTVRDLQIVNLSPDLDYRHPIFFMRNPPPMARNQAVLDDVCKAFSRPVSRDDSLAEYAATQVVAEFIRTQGFDGIAYRSSLKSDAYNVCFFNVDCARPVNGFLYEATSIEMEFEEVASPYFVNEHNGTILINKVVAVYPADTDARTS